MQIAIIFYSYTGNTRRACEFLRERLLKMHNAVDFFCLRPKQEPTKFLEQCNAAFNRDVPQLCETEYDLLKYDFIIFASPVWAFTYTPALRAYFKSCRNLKNKKTAVFLTCGSVITSGRALRDIKADLKEIGAKVFYAAYIAGKKTDNPQYLEDRFNNLLTVLE